VERFLNLYRDDALLDSPPRGPEPARSHMRRVLTAGRPDPDVYVGDPLVDGEWAVVEWRAVITISEEPKTFAGTAWLRFDRDGLVAEQRSYVQTTPGRQTFQLRGQTRTD
jgi:hypothetical protein